MPPRDDNHRRELQQNIIDAFMTRKNFLISGHTAPDGDCIFSMTALGFALTALSKTVTLVIGSNITDKHPNLLTICNRLKVRVAGNDTEIDGNYDTGIICDTAKPSLMEFKKTVQPIMQREQILVIEIDHHIGPDGEFLGNPDYSLVDDHASSTCELITELFYLMRQKTKTKFMNFDVLDSLVAGIASDSQNGTLFRNEEEKMHFEGLKKELNSISLFKRRKPRILSVAEELSAISELEKKCRDEIMHFKQTNPSISWIAVDEPTSNDLRNRFDFGYPRIVGKKGSR